MEHREALLEHLDRLYAFAQVLTPDPEHAARLVEATYRRAYAAPRAAQQRLETRPWLFQIMWDLHQEQPQVLVVEEGVPTTSTLLETYSQQQAEHILNHTLPTAYASLPGDLQLLLLLCEVEKLPLTEAGTVLRLDEETVRERLTLARNQLRDGIRTALTEDERRLLAQHLPDPWLGPALRRTLDTTLSPTPTTLQPTVALLEPAKDAQPLASNDEAEEEALRAAQAQLGQRLRRVLATMLLIIGAGALGMWIDGRPKPIPEVNVIALSAARAHDVEVEFQAGSAEQAENYVRDRLGWQLTVPEITAAPLVGVGFVEIAPEVIIPAFRYGSPDEPITLYTYTYRLLSRYADRLSLAPDILAQIEDDAQFDLHDLGEAQVLLWRNRDDIFVAVTQANAEALRDRIRFPS